MEGLALFLTYSEPKHSYSLMQLEQLTSTLRLQLFFWFMAMGSISTSAPQCRKMFAYLNPFALKTKIMCNSSQRMKLCSDGSVFQEIYGGKACGNRRRGLVEVAKGAKDDSESCNAQTARETVLKLYEAMRNRNVQEISDIIAEECLCVSNLVSLVQPFHGKKQVVDFFSSLMKKLGKNIEFVVQNTVDDGMVVGVSWNLEWKKVPLPLGKGLSFYMCHVYRGKVMIRNVEIFMEPLLHIEPLRLKVITLVMKVMEKLNLWAQFKNKRRRALTILFIILFMAAILLQV